MKKKLINAMQILALAVVTILPSCDTEALTDLNKDPNRIENVLPNYIFTEIVLNMPPEGPGGSLHQGMQYVANYKDVPDVGNKQFDYIATFSYDDYSGQLNRIKQCMDALTMPADVNKMALLRIVRAYTFHIITDAMGDVPYSDALNGITGNYAPKYDTQQDIYNDMLKELESSVASMDATKPTFGAADVIYGGDNVRWKKFAHTLMLRLAMRLSNKDAATARTWALKAIAGGVMTEINDIAFLKYNANSTNPRAPFGEYQSTQDPDNAQGQKLSSTFVNHLKSTKDPRLGILAVVWKKTGSVYVPDTTAAIQRGMIPASLLGYPADFESYSEYSPLWWNRDSSPLLIMGPAEAYLLISEAVLRGWYTGTTEKAAYDLGVTRAMEQWKLWPTVALSPNTNTVTPAQLTAYLAKGYPYNTAGTFNQRLEQISTQKWVSMLGDFYEVWSNWRRTGYPVFNYKNWNGNQPFPGSVTGGVFFRRLPYPDERATNNENQQAALARQGFPLDPSVRAQSDALLGRVWWDKP